MNGKLIHVNPFAWPGDADYGRMVDAPTIAANEWWAMLGAVAARRLTRDEIATAEALTDRGFSLRHVAEQLFGDARAAEFFAP